MSEWLLFLFLFHWSDVFEMWDRHQNCQTWIYFISFPQIQPVCNWNQRAKLKENYLQSWSFNFGLSDLNAEFGRRQRGSRQREAFRTDGGKICSSLSIWVKRGSIIWNNWNVALPWAMGPYPLKICPSNGSHWLRVTNPGPFCGSGESQRVPQDKSPLG